MDDNTPEATTKSSSWWRRFISAYFAYGFAYGTGGLWRSLSYSRT